MDDNELENEREKREHEIELAKAAKITNIWDMISDHPFMTGFIFLVLACMMSDIFTYSHSLETIFK